jgi:alditol oxidase
MKKRTFLRLSAAAGAGSILAPLWKWGGGKTVQDKLTNWAGNIEYRTRSVFAANSREQVADFVRKETKLKVLGTRHCFNTIADSADRFLSLKPMDEAAGVDAAARTVTVTGGVTYGALAPQLDAKGFALHNLASLPHISVAGACSTGTHGSGERNGNLATAVRALEMVTASGDVVRLSREAGGEAFEGAVVGLGALGAITSLTLAVEPAFAMKQHVYENMPLGPALDHFEEIQASGYSVSLFTDWREKRINEVWIKSRSDAQAFPANPEFFGARRAAKNLHPIAELSAENCTEQLGVEGRWYERLPHFKMGFTPSAGKELQSEFFVPRKHAAEAILAVERLHGEISPHLMISEIRTIAADTLWLSPCYRRDSVAIHFTWKPDWPAVRKLLPGIEKELAPFGVRPHWGKLFTLSAADLRSRYPKLPEFVELVKKYDPRGKFRNPFLERYVLGGAESGS